MSHQVRVAAVQAEPKWLQLSAGVDQVIDLMAEAARGGAQLVAFPETFVPGYPWWMWLDPPAWGQPAWGREFAARYRDNSMYRDGPEMRRIGDTARRYGIHVVLGFSERTETGQFMSQAFIDDDGTVMSVRRKQELTSVERAVFSTGVGADLRVHDTALGRLGALSAGEHLQPLLRHSMHTFGEQIHVVSRSGFSVYRGTARAFGPAVDNAAGLVYAVEGKTFVVAPCAVVGVAGWEVADVAGAVGRVPARPKKRLIEQGGGNARIYGPEGSELVTPLAENEEGILFADLDFDLIGVSRSATETGAYVHPEVIPMPARIAPLAGAVAE